MKFMFVCDYGEDGSKTAQEVAKEIFFDKYGKIETVAAGLNSFERFNDLPSLTNVHYMNGFDKIFVMSSRIQDRISSQFGLKEDRFYNLDIQDKYFSGESKLVEILNEKLIAFIDS